MPVAYDFADGKIADNILNALSNCSASAIASLKNKGLLYLPKNGGFLKYKSLYYNALDDYADASGCTIASLIFGSEDAPMPCYTPWDHYVICALNSLTAAQLKTLRTAVDDFYSCPIMASATEMSPSKRLLAILDLRFGKNLPTDIPEEEMRKYRLDVSQEIQRFKLKSHHSPVFLFHSDYWPDLAIFSGVSVRWLLGIRKHPLYCETAAADDLFDLYTVMHPYSRKSFIGILLRLSNEYIPELEQYFLDRGSRP